MVEIDDWYQMKCNSELILATCDQLHGWDGVCGRRIRGAGKCYRVTGEVDVNSSSNNNLVLYSTYMLSMSQILVNMSDFKL